MATFLITQRKLVEYVATVELELPDGVKPVEHIEQNESILADKWQEVKTSPLSVEAILLPDDELEEEQPE